MEAPTVATVREHVGTDLGDDALKRLIDAAFGEVKRIYGHDATFQDADLVSGVVADLVRLELAQTGAKLYDVGELRIDAADYSKMRHAILARMETGLGIA